MQLLRLLACACTIAPAADWPEFRGAGRGGVWTETGIVERFQDKELRPRWRTPVRAGFAGPSVANGRVFVTDFLPGKAPRGTERAIALDERTGKVLWTREWEANYSGLSYAYGPRATPTVDGDRVYVAGASGVLLALRAATGEVIWQKDYVKDYAAVLAVWGIASAPIVDGPRLIVTAGGQPGAKVIAFDKMTGKEIWRSLAADTEPGYSPPILFDRQLIIWHASAVSALDPVTGRVLWEQPFKLNAGMALATPVSDGRNLLLSAFYNGSMLLDMAGKLLWRGKSDSEINTDGLHSVVNTPVIDNGYIYGICSYGQFRCLDLRTGQRVWETMEVTGEKARWASGFVVKNGSRYFINNDRGDLIIAELSPKGYKEISRAKLIKPTSDSRNRRELGAVHWSHPAYANKHIVTRNDEEIISVSLAK